MSTPHFHHIINTPARRKEVYEQFCLDAKRMMLVIDGKEDTHLPVQCAYTWLVNLFTNEAIGLWFAYWCTQTSLASIYQTKVLDINHRLSLGNINRQPHGFIYHLVDDGRQHVFICLSNISNEHADMFIYKPFRVCYYSERECSMRTLFYYHLQVHVSTHRLGHHSVKWIQYKTKTPLTVHNDHWMLGDREDDQWVVLR